MTALSTIVGAALIAAGLAAAPTAAATVPQTDACMIGHLRRAQGFTHFDRGFPGANHAVTQVAAMTVHLELDC